MIVSFQWNPRNDFKKGPNLDTQTNMEVVSCRFLICLINFSIQIGASNASWARRFGILFQVADLSPIHFRILSATDGTKLDLNIGFNQGLVVLIQGQIYNPVFSRQNCAD